MAQSYANNSNNLEGMYKFLETYNPAKTESEKQFEPTDH